MLLFGSLTYFFFNMLLKSIVNLREPFYNVKKGRQVGENPAAQTNQQAKIWSSLSMMPLER